MIRMVPAECNGDFSQKFAFPPFLAAILNFCVKHNYLGTVQDGAIFLKFLTSRVSAVSTGDFSQKFAFLPFLAAILNFCVKRKNTFTSETVQDKAILLKF